MNFCTTPGGPLGRGRGRDFGPRGGHVGRAQMHTAPPRSDQTNNKQTKSDEQRTLGALGVI